MFVLDIRTLFFVALFFNTLYAVGMFLFARRMKVITSLYYLAFADGVMALATLLFTLRHVVDQFWSVVVANTLMVVSLAINYYSIMMFRGIPRPRGLWLYLVLFTMLHCSVFGYYTYIEPNVNARIVFISLEFGLAFIMFAELLYRKGEELQYLGSRIFAAISFGVSVFYIMRAVYSLEESSLQSFMDAGLVHCLAVVVVIVFVAFKNFLFVYATAATMVDTLDKLSKIDPLTQILNRRGLEETCELEIARIERYGGEMSVILCDLDLFKSVNDYYGHKAGDTVLKKFAKMIKEQIRATDICARIGGEEFIVVLPNTSHSGALRLAGCLREHCADISFSFNKELKITASFGVATYWEGMTFTRLMQLADKAMYQAKKRGRNQVCSAKDIEDSEAFTANSV